MKKIDKCEIERTCRVFAEIFKDYKAYDLFFPRDERQIEKIYYFYRYEIFAAQNYTYRNDDFTAVCSIKRPGDKDVSGAGLFINPLFSIKFFSAAGVKAVRLARKYIRYASSFSDKYYNPDTDCYIKNIGVAESERGKGMLKAMLEEMCKGAPVYLETHSEQNVEIYKKLGFELLETGDFMGEKHYAMKRF